MPSQPYYPDDKLWFGTSGPQDAQVVIVGEAWGAEEDQAQKPFVGSSGVEFRRIIAEAGINAERILFTNVVALRPKNNEMWRLFHPKSAAPVRIGGLSPHKEVVEEVRRLYAQISQHPRRLVIAVGNYALWALSDVAGAALLRTSNNRKIPVEEQTWAPSGIGNWRGSMWYMLQDRMAPHPVYTKTRLLPIIHPAAILRDWSQRAVTVHDLKARVKMAVEENWRRNPQPVTLSPPTFSQCIARLQLWFNDLERGNYLRLAVDLETVRKRFISVCGMADSVNFAMAIPFLKRDLDNGGIESYWTVDEEAQIVYWLRKVLMHPKVLIDGQNFIYDTQFFQTEMAFTPRLDFDTMLAQNVLFPGTPKPLEYLSSLYCTYHWYWKEDHKDWNLVGNLQVLLDYNCIDVLRTWEIGGVQREVLKHSKMTEQMEFKMKTNALCLRMMNRGVLIARNKQSSMLMELQTALQEIYRDLLAIIPQDMVAPGHKTPWYKSPKQTAYLFYDRLGFRVVKHRKTKQPTTGKEALMQLEKWYPEFKGLFARLDKAGSVDNSVGVIQTPLEHNFRMRCSFNPGGTETHRLSSSENAFGRGTNLQNISKGEEDD